MGRTENWKIGGLEDWWIGRLISEFANLPIYESSNEDRSI
jgi:hypothetical protein